MNAGEGRRLDALDAWRGAALWWMTAYHLCFDLFAYRLLAIDFYRDPVWTGQRTVILSLFLACAGVAQAVAHREGVSWGRFWRRWAQVAACALLVSLGSWLMFPRSWIHFGVLHALLVLLPLARWLAGWPVRALLALALGLLVATPLLRAWAQSGPWAEAFNGRMLDWLGLVGRKPATEDYVPLLPWAVPVLLGLAFGRWWLARGAATGAWQARGAWRALSWSGRHSLTWYMLHQPLLIAAVIAFARLSR